MAWSARCAARKRNSFVVSNYRLSALFAVILDQWLGVKYSLLLVLLSSTKKDGVARHFRHELSLFKCSSQIFDVF